MAHKLVDLMSERCAAQTNTLLLPTVAGIATLQSLGPNPRIDFLIAALGGLRGGTTGVTDFAILPRG